MSSSRGSAASDSSPKTRSNSERHPVAHGAAGPALAPGLGDQAALDERRDGRVGGNAADARDLGPRHRAEVGDDRDGLEGGLREPSLDRPLEQPRARLGGLAGGAERVAAGDLLQDDAAAALAVALAQQPERRLDALGVVGRSPRRARRA